MATNLTWGKKSGFQSDEKLWELQLATNPIVELPALGIYQKINYLKCRVR